MEGSRKGGKKRGERKEGRNGEGKEVRRRESEKVGELGDKVSDIVKRFRTARVAASATCTGRAREEC